MISLFKPCLFPKVDILYQIYYAYSYVSYNVFLWLRNLDVSEESYEKR